MYHNTRLCIKMRIFGKAKRRKMITYLETKDRAESLFMKSKTDSDQRFYLLVILALETGARVSDLLNIKIDDFRQEGELTYLFYINKKGKKKQTQRISEKTAFKVNAFMEDKESSFVFYNAKKGSLMSRITANRRCTATFDFNFHNLRKIAGKNIASQKGVIYASKFLGHSRVSTTDIYLGISADQFKKDMESVSI